MVRLPGYQTAQDWLFRALTQLVKDSNIDSFVDSVYLQLGITLIRHAEKLQASGRGSSLEGPIAAWLTSPIITSVRANLSYQGVGGIGGGVGTTFNTSTGFSRAGYHSLIRSWLEEIFPRGEGGGIVCSIDNLELLRESEAAREAFEAIRDDILTLPGLRWILCGSLGIVRTLASTPRLNGYLHDPIEIGDVDSSVAGDILESRVEAFRNDEEAYLPLTTRDFATLYHILRGNIRDTLSESDNFCNWIADRNAKAVDDSDGEGEMWAVDPTDDRERHGRFVEWLSLTCTSRLEAARPYVSKRSWKLFGDISLNGGQCSPGAFTDFGFQTPQAMRSQVISLESARLVISVRNEDDNRRKTIYITPAGWMVDYALTSGIGTLFFTDEAEDEEDATPASADA